MKSTIPVNHNAFSEITPQAAYWAGFIAADGSLRKTHGKYKCLRVYLSLTDFTHLEKLKAFLGSGHKLKVSENYSRCSLELCSNQIYDDLLDKYKITELKSLSLEFPDLPESILPHFIRGYFEGDGCICETFSNKVSIKASLITRVLGAPLFMTKYREVLQNVLGVLPKNQLHPNGVNLALKLNTNHSISFLKWVYEGSDVLTRLDRKYELYKKTIVDGNRKVREKVMV